MSIIIAIVPLVLGAIASSASVTGDVAATTDCSTTTLPTQIRNEELLYTALKNLGATNIHRDVALLNGKIDDFHITFCKNEYGVFDIQFVGEVGMESAENFRRDLLMEYGNVVQNHVYETLKNKAEQRGLTLEKEVIQADQSVVLTYNVQ